MAKKIAKTADDRYRKAFNLLAAHYGPSEELHRDSPTVAGETVLDSLVATMLTQATTDKTAIRAFQRLKADFPDWEQVMAQPGPEIAERIAVAGLANEKAARILETLRAIKERFGEATLEPLRAMSAEETRRFLLTLPGVGAKTAACVQAFSLKQNAFPVDTHVDRILKRMGWAEPKMTPVKMQNLMESEIPPEIQSALHVYLIHHGRRCCQARKPDCGRCPVAAICEKNG